MARRAARAILIGAAIPRVRAQAAMTRDNIKIFVNVTSKSTFSICLNSDKKKLSSQFIFKRYL